MRRIRAATLALFAALVLGACDGGDDPSRPKASLTPSASTPAPSSTTPAVDPLTEAPKGETARQFIRRWVALSTHMQQTGETEGFRAVSGPDCRSCRDLADQVAEIYATGGQITTSGSTVRGSHHDGGDQWTVRLDGSPAEIEGPSAEPTQFPGGNYELVLYLAKVDGLWIMGDYQDKR